MTIRAIFLLSFAIVFSALPARAQGPVVPPSYRDLVTQIADLQARIAKLEDANLATAITGMNQADASYRAALGATGKIPQLSLMDYLS